ALEGAKTPPASSAPAPAGPAHWSYTGDEGPAKWGDLSPDFAACKTGKQQTPIDFAKGIAKGKGLSPVVFSYSQIPIQVTNNGHTIQAGNSTPSSITIGSDKYTLAQWHLHTPSEHTVEGKHFDAELHFVNKNDKGEITVVGILIKKGKESKAVKALVDNAPAEASKEPKAGQGTFDMSALTPAKAAYYTYTGSLTIPPCTEGIRWIVFQKPMEASEAQLAKLQELMHGPTARPIQALEGRSVTAYAP